MCGRFWLSIWGTAITRFIMPLCSAPSMLFASLRPRGPRGLRALTAPAHSGQASQLCDGRRTVARSGGHARLAPCNFNGKAVVLTNVSSMADTTLAARCSSRPMSKLSACEWRDPLLPPLNGTAAVVLPRRRCSRAHADRGLLTFGDNNERRLNLHGGVAQGVNDREHERRGNVSRPEVDDPDERRSGADSGTAEG